MGFMNLSDFVTPAGVCLSMGFGNYVESFMLDCDTEAINYYKGSGCDNFTNSTDVDGMQCDAEDCDYAVIRMNYDNGSCVASIYEEFAFAMGCVSAEGYNLNLYCDGETVMAEVLLSPCGLSTGTALDASTLMAPIVGTSCYTLTCYESGTAEPTTVPTTSVPTSDPTEDVVGGDASCMLSVGGMTVLLAIIGLVQ